MLIEEYRDRELDLLELQATQIEKMKGLKKKAETTVGQMADEIEMLSSELHEMRALLEQEVKKRRHEEKTRRTLETINEDLRRDLSHAREGMRQSEVNLVKAVAERDRFEAILDKVGSGAMDELELRCQEAEQMRFRSEGELSKLRAEINWQASARMDDKLSLQSVEDELANVRSSKRQVESKLMEMEDEVEKVSSQLRAKKEGKPRAQKAPRQCRE